MAASSPIFELLERNQDIFDNKDVVIVGDILDPMVLSLIKQSKSAVLVCDNYVVCKSMAAMIGQSLDNSIKTIVEYKHVKLVFAPIEDALKEINHIDSLVVLLSKSKQQTLKLINSLKGKYTADTSIYTAGANDGGGKSADSILKVIGLTRKVDLARKCTLFKCTVDNSFNTYTAPKDICVSPLGISIKLKQDVAVFSQGKLDNGTAMLIESLKDITPQGKALDLGCGCGVVGITLSKLGFKDVTSSDISATALTLTKENAKLNECNDIQVVASDMLSSLGNFDVIAVNPPFHVGITTTTAPTVNMIITSKDHLNEGGVMYLVANAHLHYEKYLEETFSKVEIVKKSTTFIVYKATR